MDSMITAAARALAAGDPLDALNRIALREDAPALALRGIAMAQLGDLERAKTLVRRAGRAFGPKETMARARCVVVETEIALASRDLAWPAKSLATAVKVLESHGDLKNAAHARLLEVRRLLLIGCLDDAQDKLAQLEFRSLSPALRAIYELAVAGISMRRVRATAAQAALARAEEAARWAHIPALSAEVEQALDTLGTPAAKMIAGGDERPLLLKDVEALLASDALVIDACRNLVRMHNVLVPLTTRPVLFALTRALGEAWPGDVPRDVLLARAFGARQEDESHRARLRVEVGRLRKLLHELAGVSATPRGFALSPHGQRAIVVLARPVEEEHAALLAFLADGEAWSSSALALALNTSQRTVQRTLDTLAASGKAQPVGDGRARRWTMPPLPGFATTLLLPAPFPNG